MTAPVSTTDFTVDSLPLDVFELADSGLQVDSLTAGHGLVENGASDGPWIFTSGGTACCCSMGACQLPEFDS